jgi:hypothetical protein
MGEVTKCEHGVYWRLVIGECVLKMLILERVGKLERLGRRGASTRRMVMTGKKIHYYFLTFLDQQPQPLTTTGLLQGPIAHLSLLCNS